MITSYCKQKKCSLQAEICHKVTGFLFSFSSTASYSGLVLGGTQTGAVAAHALGHIPTEGSLALVPTVLNTGAGGARAPPRCRTAAVTLAAG